MKMEPLLDSWDINARLNLYLLEAISDDSLAIKLEKGKTVLGNFTHIHSVRLMWLKAGAPELLEGITKFEGDVNRESLVLELEKSAKAIRTMVEQAVAPEGRIKGFKPHVTGFVGYMISHETFHRTCIEIALRQSGHALTDKVAYGLWEWGTR